MTEPATSALFSPRAREGGIWIINSGDPAACRLTAPTETRVTIHRPRVKEHHNPDGRPEPRTTHDEKREILYPHEIRKT